MKNGWVEKPLEEIGTTQTGSTPKTSEKENFGDFIPFLKPADFATDGSLDYANDGLSEVGLTKARRVPAGSVLMVCIGATIGKCGYCDQCVTTNQQINSLTPANGVSHKFVYYQMLTEDFQRRVLLSSAQATLPIISKAKWSRLGVTLAPPVEQRRIVGILDEAFEGLATAKANAEQNLQNARALFESHLQAVFTQRGDGWVEKPLDEIGTTQTGSTPKTSDRANFGDFIAFVKPADFNADGSVDYENDGLSEKGLSTARMVAAGSVLMVCIGATIGKCGYCERDITTNQQINALTPTDGSSHRFLYYQMLTEGFQRKVIHGSGQATLPIINKSKWSALPVWLPPTVKDQKRIAARFDTLLNETQRLESLYQRKLAALDELKKSLLHRAFSGQL